MKKYKADITGIDGVAIGRETLNPDSFYIGTIDKSMQNYDIVIGYKAAFSYIKGNYNIIIGSNAAPNFLEGSYNIMIGHGVAKGIKKTNNLFCLKIGKIEIKFKMTKLLNKYIYYLIDNFIRGSLKEIDL